MIGDDLAVINGLAILDIFGSMHEAFWDCGGPRLERTLGPWFETALSNIFQDWSKQSKMLFDPFFQIVLLK